MKSTVLVLIITAVASAISLSQTSSQCKELEADLSTLRSFHPRSEGTAGDAATQEYLLDQLRAFGLSPRRISIGSQVAGHSFSAGVTARIEGSLPDTLVFAAPLNHPEGTPPGRDGSAAIAVLLALARIYAETTPPLTLQFAVLGADYDGRDLGSRSFIEELDLRNPNAVVYLAQKQDSPTYAVRSSAPDAAAPRRLVEDVTEAFNLNDIRYRVSLSRAQAARAGQIGTGSPLGHYLSEGVPALALVDAPLSEDTGVPCDLTSALADFVETYQEGLPDTWDRHYLFYQHNDGVLFIGETSYLVVLVVVVLAALLYGLLFRGRLSRYVETLGRNFFNLPIVFLVIFGALAIAGALFDQILTFRDFPQLWEYYPLVFFLGRLLLAAAIYDVFHRIFLTSALSKNGSYYSASALAALFVGILILAFIDISTTPYVLWAFVFAFLFSIARFRLLKVLAFLASTLLLLQFVVEIFRAPLPEVAENLVRAGSIENLLIAVVLLPFVLMLIRVDFLFRRGPLTGRGPFAIGLLILFSVGGLGGAAFATFTWPFSNERPQAVRMIETIDHRRNTHTIVFESEASLGSFDVSFGDELLAVQTDARRFAVGIEGMPDLVKLSQRERRFLNRSRRELTIDADFPLDLVDVSLVAQEIIAILDANFPVAAAEPPDSAPGADRLAFQIGPSPPLPLILDYTVPRELSPAVLFEGRSARLSRSLAVERDSIDISPQLVIRKTLEEP